MIELTSLAGIRTRQSPLIRSVLSIALKNRWPFGISLDIRTPACNFSSIWSSSKKGRQALEQQQQPQHRWRPQSLVSTSHFATQPHFSTSHSFRHPTCFTTQPHLSTLLTIWFSRFQHPTKRFWHSSNRLRYPATRFNTLSHFVTHHTIWHLLPSYWIGFNTQLPILTPTYPFQLVSTYPPVSLPSHTSQHCSPSVSTDFNTRLTNFDTQLPGLFFGRLYNSLHHYHNNLSIPWSSLDSLLPWHSKDSEV